MQTRPGELFSFYNGDEIFVTEEFGKEAITKEKFYWCPSIDRSTK